MGTGSEWEAGCGAALTRVREPADQGRRADGSAPSPTRSQRLHTSLTPLVFHTPPLCISFPSAVLGILFPVTPNGCALETGDYFCIGFVLSWFVRQ